MSKRIPILFCIDAEPDVRKVEPNARLDWVGFEKSFEFFQDLRPKLAAATGARANFSWFLRMDPQISRVYGSPDWVVTRYRDLIDELEAAGDEIGLHSHAWRWDDHVHDWIADYGNEEWVDHCITLAFDAFEKSFERPCRSFRFGDHWMSERSLDLLERLGTHFDLTLEPGQAVPMLLPDELFTGTFPDCKRISQTPYRPDRADFTKPGLGGKRKLWLVPVSAESTKPVPLPQQSPTRRLFSNPKGDEIYVTLNLAFSRAVFSTIADRLLSLLSHPLLVVVARTDVALVPEQRANLEQNIEYLLSHPLIERFVCETPAAAVRRPAFRSGKMVETEDTEPSMNTQIRHKSENQANSSRSPTRPRILFVVDTPNWAHDFKTENIKRLLDNDYEIHKCYETELTEADLDRADLILVYYWLQLERFRHLSGALKRNRHKLLVGISSNWELEADRREPGLALIREWAGGVFVNNLLLYHEYQPVLKMPVFYTPNGVDTRFYQPPVSRESNYPVRVGWAGSLTNREAGYRGYHDVIVPAVSAVEGVELVTATGEKNQWGPEEMRRFYHSLDVYVCASRTEGTPNPCLEAAACGVPLVTTPVGNMPELVRSGVNGFFIGRDVQNLAEKLCLLRDDAALRTSMAQHIHRDIQSWDWSIRAQAYRLMFEVALSREETAMPRFAESNGRGEARVVETPTAGVMFDETSVQQVRGALEDKARRNLALLPEGFFEEHRQVEVTIVMLSHGRLEQTLNSIHALKRNVRIPFELVLIDNNSGVEIQSKLKDFCAGLDFVNLVLLAENLGCAGGRMYGLNYVTTEFVMFLDNDVEVLPGTVEHLLHSLQSQPEIVAASGNIILPNGAVHLCGADYWTENEILFYELLEAGKRFDEPGIGKSGPVRWTSGGATLIRKSVLVDNPFDVSMKAYYEDLEWSYRLNKKGLGRFYKNVAALALHHHERVSFDELDAVEERRRQSAPYIETIAYFYKTHGKIIQNLFDFVPELGSPTDALSISSAKIFLELVNTQGCQWTIDKWNNDELAPLFLAQPLSAQIAEQKRILLASEQLETELKLALERETQLELAFQQREAQLEAQLERVTNSLGWRLLNYYGPIKYRFVLPAYRGIKKILARKPRTLNSPVSETSRASRKSIKSGSQTK